MDRVLVIADGSVAGLLACAAAGERSVIWTPQSDADAYLIRRRAVERQAQLYGLSPAGGPSLTSSSDGVGGMNGQWASRMLLEACFLAQQAGLPAIVWPVTAGAELELASVAAAIDRALLVGRLASLDQERPLEVRTPYADFTDRQLADLILDMDLPIWTCWWYDAAGDTAAERERDHWARLLNQAGWQGDLPTPELATRTRSPDRPLA